jgi:hypothetical protein
MNNLQSPGLPLGVVMVAITIFNDYLFLKCWIVTTQNNNKGYTVACLPLTREREPNTPTFITGLQHTTPFHPKTPATFPNKTCQLEYINIPYRIHICIFLLKWKTSLLSQKPPCDTRVSLAAPIVVVPVPIAHFCCVSDV